MDYRELMTAPLATLANLALDATISPAARLSGWEAVLARIGETAHGWNGFDHGERATIRRAMALDLSSLGFMA